ncbi:hypothetical protein B7P43_G06320 [Cryptotermes secundus]|uniref:DUF4817 domain-containing protein n=1 Tax=Cryptotermes secundus TaxID=105785 RepID=A0A2J7Q7H7_9NEOP|nr:hypothetical protein B7P43_G06320 [Cryptotermes secundus]
MNHVTVVPHARCKQKTTATMAERLFFEQRKAVLKWYWKYENIKEVQRQWQNEFGTQLPTHQTIAHIRDKFEADGTVHDVHKQRSG